MQQQNYRDWYQAQMHLNEQTTVKSSLWSLSDFNQLFKALRWLMLSICYKVQIGVTLPSETHTVGLNNHFSIQMLEGYILDICVKNPPPSDAHRVARMAADDYFSQCIGDCLYRLQARKWKLFQTDNNRGRTQLWHQLLCVQRFTADFTAELTATSRRWIHSHTSYFKRKRDRLQTT